MDNRKKPLPGLCCKIFFYLAVFVSSSCFAVADDKIRTLITEQFIEYDPDYLVNYEKYGALLEESSSQLAELEAQGHQLDCSKQIFLEAKWLHRYTAHWEELDDKLKRLKTSFDDHDQSFATRQLPTTGFWGTCYDVPFMRLAATVDRLSSVFSQGKKPRYRLLARDRLNTAKKLLLRLQDLLISDIANTGVNNRAELNSLLTSISQGLFKHYIRDGLVDHIDFRSDSTLETIGEAFRFFISGAQDQETGYWGAWYLADGKVHKTLDLSMTYHIVAYTKGEVVPNWAPLIDTTFAIKDRNYPYGWLHQGRRNNHHNYDVARIFKYAWPHMTEDQQARTRAELGSMLEWSLSNTLKPDGSFIHDATFSDSLADEYYFGVSFFDVIGYWNPEQRFWSQSDEIESNAVLCCKIWGRIDELGLGGWAAEGAKHKLKRNCSTC